MPEILIAPGAFKGTFSPSKLAELIELAFCKATSSGSAKDVKQLLVPLADGGDGTVDAVHTACGGTRNELMVNGALGQEQKAFWLQMNSPQEQFKKVALVELANCCGIAGLPALNAKEATTFGLGQVIKSVIEKLEINNSTVENPELNQSKSVRIFIALGGSASTDGGAGALAALGATFYDEAGNQLRKFGGGHLESFADFNLSPAIDLCKNTEIELVTDVQSPLLGDCGAAKVFAPQKGASPEDILVLERNLEHFANLLERAKQSHELCRNTPGAGAAGGTAFGLSCALGAKISNGFLWLANICQLEEKIVKSDLVISGEGRIDSSSAQGKVCHQLADLCRKHRKPLWLVAGSVGPNINAATIGVDRIIELTDGSRLAGEEEILEKLQLVFRESAFGNMPGVNNL